MNDKDIKKKREFRERRYIDFSLEKREEVNTPDEDFYHIEGKAIAIGEKTLLYDFDGVKYYEIIEPDAFKNTDISDIVLNVDHGNGDYAVARTRNSTLKLDLDSSGGYIHALLSKKNPRCVQFYTDVDEGLLDKMSWAFTIDDEEFDEETNTFHVKSIKKIYDVSAVEFPAYENTTISAQRSQMLVGIEEKRAVALKKAELNSVLNQIIGKESGGSQS